MHRLLTLAGVLTCLLAIGPPASAADSVIQLHEAVAQGKVTVEVTATGGSTGDTIQISVKRSGNETLRLELAPGTWFRSISGKVQNMLGTRIKGKKAGASSYVAAPQVDILDDQPQVLVIEAYCMDFHKPNPAAGDAFQVVAPTTELALFARAANASGQSVQRVQAALWIRRGGVTDAELLARFPVTPADLSAARTWLEAIPSAASNSKPEAEKPAISPQAAVESSGTALSTEQLSDFVAGAVLGAFWTEDTARLNGTGMFAVGGLKTQPASVRLACAVAVLNTRARESGTLTAPLSIALFKRVLADERMLNATIGSVAAQAGLRASVQGVLLKDPEVGLRYDGDPDLVRVIGALAKDAVNVIRLASVLEREIPTLEDEMKRLRARVDKVLQEKRDDHLSLRELRIFSREEASWKALAEALNVARRGN